MVVGEQAIGNELDVAARRNVVESADGRELLRKPFNALRHVRPVIVLALAENHAVEGDAPGLLRTVRKTQALERNGKKRHVAIVQDAAEAVPQRVETIVVALAFGINRVRLHTEGVGEEIVGAVKIVKGVKQHADAVVLIRGLAFGQMRANLAGLVAANENDVEIFVVVRKIGCRRFRRGGAVTGKILTKIAYGEFHFAGTVFEEVL